MHDHNGSCDHSDINKNDVVLVRNVHIDQGMMVGNYEGHTVHKFVLTLHLDGSSVLSDGESTVEIETTKLIMLDSDVAESLINEMMDSLIQLRVREKLSKLGVNTDGMDV